MNSKKEEVENLLSHFDSRIIETHERVTNASQESAQVSARRPVPVDGPLATVVFINGWVRRCEASSRPGVRIDDAFARQGQRSVRGRAHSSRQGGRSRSLQNFEVRSQRGYQVAMSG